MKWVFIDEKIPEPGERVLFSTASFVGEGYISTIGEWFRIGAEYPVVKVLGKVLGWQPLPEPMGWEG